MATKEYEPVIAELRRMDAVEVRENTMPSLLPDPMKRTMAITELERRRQERAPDKIKDPIIGPGAFLLVCGIALAAAAYWMFLA